MLDIKLRNICQPRQGHVLLIYYIEKLSSRLSRWCVYARIKHVYLDRFFYFRNTCTGVKQKHLDGASRVRVFSLLHVTASASSNKVGPAVFRALNIKLKAHLTSLPVLYIGMSFAIFSLLPRPESAFVPHEKNGGQKASVCVNNWGEALRFVRRCIKRNSLGSAPRCLHGSLQYLKLRIQSGQLRFVKDFASVKLSLNKVAL